MARKAVGIYVEDLREEAPAKEGLLGCTLTVVVPE
jgi:hypothetical protein